METAPRNLPTHLHGSSAVSLPATLTPEKARETALACSTPQEALSQPTLNQLARHFGDERVVIIQVAAIIEKSMAYFAEGRKLETEQIALFAKQVAKRYQHESLADVNVFMEKAALGGYGKGETYGRLDLPRLGAWWEEYLNEKAEARERSEIEARNIRQREAEQGLAAIPGLSETVNKAVADNAERLREDARRRRMGRLRDQFRIMTDQDLRAAYVKFRDADTRSVILAEAKERGLLDQSMNKALREVEENAKAEAAALSVQPLPTPSTQVA